MHRWSLFEICQVRPQLKNASLHSFWERVWKLWNVIANYLFGFFGRSGFQHRQQIWSNIRSMFLPKTKIVDWDFGGRYQTCSHGKTGVRLSIYAKSSRISGSVVQHEWREEKHSRNLVGNAGASEKFFDRDFFEQNPICSCGTN